MSTLTESLATERHAARYSNRPARTAGSTHESTRMRAGWLLIGLGLRLALPGGQGAVRRSTLVGR